VRFARHTKKSTASQTDDTCRKGYTYYCAASKELGLEQQLLLLRFVPKDGEHSLALAQATAHAPPSSPLMIMRAVLNYNGQVRGL
jgi:hypothetical protein